MFFNVNNKGISYMVYPFFLCSDGSSPRVTHNFGELQILLRNSIFIFINLNAFQLFLQQKFSL